MRPAPPRAQQSAPWVGAREMPRGLARMALVPLELVAFGYGLGARLHRACYERHLLAQRKLACRVVSVGSLTAGGAGKTPFSAWLATRLRERGNRVALATRGYGRPRVRGDVVETLSDGQYVTGEVTLVGDEPLVLAAHAHRVPVLVGRDRGLVGLRAISTFGIDVLVLDDGFQHHRLARDLDIVLVDGEAGFGNRRLLPAGPLREPVSALARADAVGVVDPPAEGTSEDAALEAELSVLARRAPGTLRLRAFRKPVSVRPITGIAAAGAAAAEPPESLAGLRVGVLAALGRPEALRRTVESLGATVVAYRSFLDHHRYTARDLHDLHRSAHVWITTEKDAVKILPGWAARIDLRVLSIELAVEQADAFVDWVEEKIFPRSS